MIGYILKSSLETYMKKDSLKCVSTDTAFVIANTNKTRYLLTIFNVSIDEMYNKQKYVDNIYSVKCHFDLNKYI